MVLKKDIRRLLDRGQCPSCGGVMSPAKLKESCDGRIERRTRCTECHKETLMVFAPITVFTPIKADGQGPSYDIEHSQLIHKLDSAGYTNQPDDIVGRSKCNREIRRSSLTEVVKHRWGGVNCGDCLQTRHLGKPHPPENGLCRTLK